VTGLLTSVVRAAFVASIVVWAREPRLRVNELNVVGVAGVVLLVVRPLDVSQLGFQLSFAATGGFCSCIVL
tara:strand:+ start:80 stop:292 length:213 start_codon:yes stop_codon:yes gene_type:complete